MDTESLYKQFLANVEPYYVNDEEIRSNVVLQDIVDQITPDNVDQFVTLLVNTPNDDTKSIFSSSKGVIRSALLTVFSQLAPCLPSLALTIKIYQEVDYWNTGVNKLRKLLFEKMERSEFFQLVGRKCDRKIFEADHGFFTEDEITEEDLCDTFRGILRSGTCVNDREMMTSMIIYQDLVPRFHEIMNEYENDDYFTCLVLKCLRQLIKQYYY